jgi:hypothetical protein
MLTWIDGAPQLDKDSDEVLVQFIDQYVSCSLSEISDITFIQLQIHKHSRKGRKPICRFNFPLPPMPATKILRPFEVEPEEMEQHKLNYKLITNKLDAMGDGSDISFEEFLDELELSEEDYYSALRTSINGPRVFLKRQSSEIRVNAYMKSLINTWKANHDIQFVLDAFACAIYIVSYVSKSARGMSNLLYNAWKEAKKGDTNLRQ